MKTILYFVLTLLIVSCSPSKEEELIRNYEEIDGNTRTNLNLSFEKIQFVKNITSEDSLKVYTNQLNNYRNELIQLLENQISNLENTNETLNEMINKKDPFGTSNNPLYTDVLKQNEEMLENTKQKLELLKIGYEGTSLETFYNMLNVFKSNLDSVLSKEYDVIYTFQNPKMNNVDQKIYKKVYFDSELTKIIRVVNDSINK